MEVRNIGVVGSGQMGHGIAQVAIQSGFSVILSDISEVILNRAYSKINDGLDRMVKKGKIKEEEKYEAINRLTLSVDIESLKEMDIIIEAIPENENLKKDMFNKLDNICDRRTILASNTSAIPITLLASATNRKDKVIGMHFMNPVPVMRGVEIIKGFDTSKETVDTIKSVAQKMGKEIMIAKDYPGFLGTRLIMPLLNEAFYAVYEERASIEDIDRALKLGANHPMGPLELADFIGIDSVLSILKNLYESYGEDKYFPCPILTQMVRAGRLGKKSGKGFYDYNV
jgi:3-hydroxybutyryl-CoA dehydrogenase